jgi:hypothetical protein
LIVKLRLKISEEDEEDKEDEEEEVLTDMYESQDNNRNDNQ